MTKIIQKNWREAKEYCDDLVLNDKDDWRLPNKYEFGSIIDYKKYSSAINSAFTNLGFNLMQICPKA